MSGRGKGGKGLGKGGAKRHRKVLRDNIQGEHGLHCNFALLLHGFSFVLVAPHAYLACHAFAGGQCLF